MSQNYPKASKATREESLPEESIPYSIAICRFNSVILREQDKNL